MGLVLEITLLGAPQYYGIADHDNTSLRPDNPFPVFMGAGVPYRILSPVARLTGDPLSDVSIPSLRVVCPWVTGNLQVGDTVFPGGPAVIFAFLGIDCSKAAFTPSIQTKGGLIQYAGVTLGGSGGGLLADGGAGVYFGPFDFDPVFGLAPGDFTTLFNATLGARNTGFNAGAIRHDNGGIIGSPISRGVGGYYFSRSTNFLFGGSVVGGQVRGDDHATVEISPDPTVPFLIKATAAGLLSAYRLTRHCFGEVDATELRALGAGIGAFRVDDSFLNLRVNPTTGGGDIPGGGLEADNGGKIQAAAAVIFLNGGPDCRAGSSVSTFGALIPTAPVTDDPAAQGGTAPAGPGSGARVYRG
jgi:hypothetical protein